MTTILTEPTDSLDPDFWAVYGDWLSDQGDDLGGERARAISRGLHKTGGNLWLQCKVEEEKWTQSPFHLDSKYRTKPYIPVAQCGYRWVESPSKEWTADVSNNPVKNPDPFLRFPHIVRAYWDKLAEIGGVS